MPNVALKLSTCTHSLKPAPQHPDTQQREVRRAAILANSTTSLLARGTSAAVLMPQPPGKLRSQLGRRLWPDVD